MASASSNCCTNATTTATAPLETAAHFFEELKDAVVKAFMSAPQMDVHHGARVPVDFGVSSRTARQRVAHQGDSASAWSLSPQLPLTTTC